MVCKWKCEGCKREREHKEGVKMKICHVCQQEMVIVQEIKESYKISAVCDTEEDIRSSIGMGLSIGSDEE